MASVRVFSLDSATDAVVEEMVKVANDAYVDDKYIMMMTGGDDRFKSDLFRLSIRSTLMEGTVTVCQDRSSRRILTIALSFGPGKIFLGSDKQRKLGFDDYIKKLSNDGQTWWENLFKKIENFPKEILDNWFTIVLATSPEEQRKGYGTLVMKEVLRMAAKDGASAMLSAEDINVPFYEALGFRVQGTVVTESPYGTYISHPMLWKREE